MYYETGTARSGAVLPRNPFKALVVPRPIGWISTLSSAGVINVAPYSFFQAVSDTPDIVMFSASPWTYAGDRAVSLNRSARKHSEENARATGEFVCSLATWELREEVNATSGNLPDDVSEADVAALAMAPSVRVRPPRVAATPAALECVYLSTIPLKDRHGRAVDYRIVLGEVIGIYLDEAFVVDGRVDTAAMRPISRMGYDEYAVVLEAFRMTRPELSRSSSPRVGSVGQDG